MREQLLGLRLGGVSSLGLPGIILLASELLLGLRDLLEPFEFLVLRLSLLKPSALVDKDLELSRSGEILELVPPESDSNKSRERLLSHCPCAKDSNPLRSDLNSF